MADDGDVVKYGYHEKPLRLNNFLCVFYVVGGTQCHVNRTQSTYCTLDTIKGSFILERRRYRFQMSSKKVQFIHVYTLNSDKDQRKTSLSRSLMLSLNEPLWIFDSTTWNTETLTILEYVSSSRAVNQLNGAFTLSESECKSDVTSWWVFSKFNSHSMATNMKK